MIVTQQNSQTELLTARQIIASALASALADPRAPLAQRANGADLGVIAHSWAEIVCNSEALHRDSLGLGERLPQDVTALASDGTQLLAGLADGRIVSLKQ